MTLIAHQQVRALLQAAANKPLPSQEQMIVEAHLAQCNQCRAYAQSLNELEDGLRRVMRQQWNVHNTPLPIRAIKDRSKRVALQNKITETIGRFVVFPLLTFAFVMAVRTIVPQQITLNTGAMTARTPQLSWRTPTPSYRNTATELTVRDCDRAIIYTVQENDTLDSIAARYGILGESILAYNGLASNKLEANTELAIPLCELTPTGTSTVPSLTITTLPLNENIDPSPQG